MALLANQIVELERIGVEGVRQLLGRDTAPHPNATVPLSVSPQPRRDQVEGWLGAKAAEAENLSARRHAEVAIWTKIAAVAAIVGAIAAVVGVVATLWH
jgi:hypothetical protein